mmetsp:Transcript_65296/g.181110  ORF Transcript_65296/g.181110 Transcript_65296/m.181110 type:complete len:540 (-) Transcript_65296:151-1770(-)
MEPINCTGGRFLVSNVLVEHGRIAHGEVFHDSCPVGFNGTFGLRCLNGKVSLVKGGVCRASCTAGMIWVDDGRVDIAYTRIQEGFPLLVRCPTGSAGQGVNLACADDTLRVVSADCTKISQCNAGTVSVLGVPVRHGAMEDGGIAAAPCPEGYSGGVNVTCREGTAMPEPGAVCHADCPTGWLRVGPRVLARCPSSRHGETVLAVCPDGYAGSVPVQCWEGNISLAACHGPGCACEPDGRGAQQPSPGRSFLLPALAVPFLAVLCLVAGMSVYHWRHEDPAADAEGADAGVTPTEVVVEPSVPLPLYWATKEGVHIFPDPNRMDEMQRLMSDTWRACYTRDRRLIAGERKVPSGCRVANVLRIENCEAYGRYWQHVAGVGRRRCAVGCKPFRTQTTGRLNSLDSSLNETYLFHGTNPDSAHAIAKDLFRIDKAGSCGGAMFGPGIYLAENASKSDEYAKEGSGVYVGLCAMLVCRAVLGEVLTVSGAGDCSARVLSGEYDCVCGDRLAAAGTFRELVFFREESVYAEFIVIYARIYGDD